MSGWLDNVIVRLVLYYAVLLAAFNAVLLAFPWVAEAVARERLRAAGSTLIGALPADAPLPNAVPLTDLQVLLPIVLTLVGALALALPVAHVYQWTREPEPYRRDFGRALIALPIAVALAVFLVKNSLALAFSLAGIVAAIRWRAALRETMDGVFMFVVIGIGLAAGVQLLMVALVASIVFNAMILALSRAGYATRPRQLSGWTLAAPMPADDAPRDRDVRLRIEASDQMRAEAHVEALLALCAKQWERSGVSSKSDGRFSLEYRAVLRKHCTPESLRAALTNPGIPEIVELELVR